MKNIIVMSGDIGSGKSSVATALQQLTGFDIIGTGTIQRAIATRRGLTTLELNKISQTDRSVDDEIDSYVVETGQTQDRLILDSRLAWHFIPTAFKVYLSVDSSIGAQRVFNASRDDEHNPSLAATLENNLKRQAIEDQRFQKLYNIHFRRYGNYDLIIDTSYNPPEVIAQKIKECFDAWLNQQTFAALWLAPRKLLPTRLIEPDTEADTAQQTVEVFLYNGFIYIWQGHHRVYAAHQADTPLIAAKLITEYANDELADGIRAAELAHTVSPTLLNSWETLLGFNYDSYPKI